MAIQTQQLIVVDAADSFLGYASRADCHWAQGLLHRAIALLIVNDRSEVLLQKRRNHLWDGYWDITGATHPLHLPERDESYEEAAERCLLAEWGIHAELRPAFAFTYFATHGEECENELCCLLVGRYDGPIAHVPDHAYGSRWVSLADLAAEVRSAPESFTPWALVVVERLLERPAVLGGR
jgi:isopentenyl-diphosphate delta-isomerase type 1